MPRTVIALEKSDKDWVDKLARAERVPMTEIVRRAIRRYRREAGQSAGGDIHRLLQHTRGTWRRGDALAYQTRLRKEWANRA